MNTKNYPAPRREQLVLLLPLLALFGALFGIVSCKKHRHCHEERRERGDLEYGHCSHEHGCHGGHRGHFDHDHWGREQGLKRRGFDPIRILDKRFAAGEIDEEEYLRRRTVLKENS